MEASGSTGHFEGGLRRGSARCCCLQVQISAGLCAVVRRLRQIGMLHRIVQSVWQCMSPWGPVHLWSGVLCVKVLLLSPFERGAEDAVDGEGAGELGPHFLLWGGEPGVLTQHLCALLVLRAPLGDALPPAPEDPISKGVLAVRVKHPVVVFPPGPGRVPEHFEEAVVE